MFHYRSTLKNNHNEYQIMLQIKFLLLVITLLMGVSANPVYAKSSSKPELMLANVYHEGINLDQYWVSEKYDGVRALWDGEKFMSRGGNIYHAPEWFVRDFPKQVLDGELWIGRQQFELLVGTVRDHQPDDEAWEKVTFMVFDMPKLSTDFDSRLKELNTVIKRADIKWLKAVKQWKVASHQQLMQELAVITEAGAEGLMLHRGSSLYKGKRSGDLLKVKPYEDAEALVIGHIPGKGKYTDKMGALLVETFVASDLKNNDEKVRFKLGTGFTDEERSNPPKIGDVVTFQYRGKTKNKVPRFASFLRIREVGKNKEFTD
jgi:DNA ligase-1